MKKGKNMNKALFLGMVSAFLLGVPISLALTLNAQNTTICGIDYCTTTVELSKYFTSQQISAAKGMNLTDSIKSIKNMNISNFSVSFNGTSAIFSVRMHPATNTYWNLTLGNLNIDPWANSSLPYCMNMTYTTTSTANYTGRVVRFNITNMTGFNSTNGSDVYFYNDSYVNSNLIELSHVITNWSTNSWFTGFIRLDYINNGTKRNISACWGNLTAIRSDGNKVFNQADTSNGLYDNFTTNGAVNSTMFNNSSAVSVGGGYAWLNATGAWWELFTKNTFNTSFCMETMVLVADMTSNSISFGVQQGGGTAPMNSFQAAYPNANWNFRNYISGENSAAAGRADTYALFEVCRNNSAFNQSYAQYKMSGIAWYNYTGTQILNTNRDFRFSVVTNGKYIAVDWVAIWFNPYPEPIPTYGNIQTSIVPPLPLIIDGSVVCFTTQPVCVKFGSNVLYFKNDNNKVFA